MKTKLTTVFVLLLIAVIGSACGSASVESGEVTSVFTEAEARRC